MAEPTNSNSAREYHVIAQGSATNETNIILLIAQVYGLGGNLKFPQCSLSNVDIADPIRLAVYKSPMQSSAESLVPLEEAQGLQAIIDGFVRDYKAATPSPGRKNRLTMEHPWYFSGYRAIKDRLSKLMSWCCVDLLQSIKDVTSVSTSSRLIHCIPADILKLSRILKMHTFVVMEKITLPDFVCFVLSHAFLVLCIEVDALSLVYSSMSELLDFVNWFNVMEDRPEVVKVREASHGNALRRLSISQAPLWPSSMPSFDQESERIIRERQAVRNCVTDKQTRKNVTAKEKEQSKLVNDGVTFRDIHSKLTTNGWVPHYDDNGLRDDEIVVPWDHLPAELDPTSGGLTPERARKKRRQIDNLVRFARSILSDESKVVDFCGGGGHLSIVLAWLFPRVQVHLVDRNAVHLALAQQRITKLETTGFSLSNIHIHNQDIRDWKMTDFQLGMAIHSCGVLCDLVQEICIRANAAYLIVPCCFGSLKNNNASTDIRVPRSDKWSSGFGLVKHEYDIVCSVADRGSESWKTDCQERQDSRMAMAIIDEDRQQRAREAGYSGLFHLTLQPPTITPKNEVIIGLPPQFPYSPTFSLSETWPADAQHNLTIRT